MVPTFASDRDEGITSAAAQREAARLIPFDKLDAASRRKVSTVVSNVSLFRRLPTQIFSCDPELYLFLVDHPDVLVNIWNELGMSKVEVERTAPNRYVTDDGTGTMGRFEYLYRSHDKHLIFVDGQYEGPLLGRAIRAKGILLLRTAYVREPDGRYYITNRMDAFFSFDRLGQKLAVKAFQPLVGRTADHNFREANAFMGFLSLAAEANQQGLQQLAAKLTHIEPRIRKEFASVAAKVASKASGRPLQTEIPDLSTRERTPRPSVRQ